jgi:hypothetical protein
MCCGWVQEIRILALTRSVQTLFNRFSQFAEMKQGRYLQQVVDEFLGAVMS